MAPTYRTPYGPFSSRTLVLFFRHVFIQHMVGQVQAAYSMVQYGLAILQNRTVPSINSLCNSSFEGHIIAKTRFSYQKHTKEVLFTYLLQ